MVAAQIMGMNGPAIADLEQLGFAAAQEVAGSGVVLRVSVEEGENSDGEPVYSFSFLIDQKRSLPQRPGLFRIRLGLRLLDDLLARGDERFPIIHIMNEAEWGKLLSV